MEKTLVRITTVPMAFKALLTGQPRFMRSKGFNVIMMSADGREREDVIKAEGCPYIVVPMTRKITPLQDLKSFFNLRKLLKQYKPDIVHTHTPKAGLLGMMAARSLGIKARIHTVAGLPLMVETGFKRKLLLFTEKLTYRFATEVWPNSFSMRDFILEHQLATPSKLKVMNHGSTNGVDLSLFSRGNIDENTLAKIRVTVPDSPAKTLLCVGRMVKDKGITELVSAYQEMKNKFDCRLVLVGPFEHELDPLPPETVSAIQNDPDITHVDWSDEVAGYMSVADIFIHPSHREGFPNVILQAGAMGLPVVCSAIPGNVDIVKDDQTAYVFATGSASSLLEKITEAFSNPGKTSKIAAALQQEVTVKYSRSKMHETIFENYQRLLQARAQ